MKTLFAIALCATAFSLVSCGAKPADANVASTTTTTPTATPAPAAQLSFTDKLADCTCEAVNKAAKLKAEIDAAPADKKEELTKKAAEAMEKPACMTELEIEMKKIESDTTAEGKAKMEAIGKEVQATIDKKCGAAMKELTGM